MAKCLLFISIFNFLFCAFASAQVGGPRVDPGAPMEMNSETGASLFMLSLFEKGYAGGQTGICVDYSNADGKSQIKIGMNTAAFDLGSAGTKNRDSNSAVLGDKQRDTLKKLLHELASAQGTPIRATITGYADGKHYQDAYAKGVDAKDAVVASIAHNVKLSQERAETIASLFAGDEKSIQVVGTSGYASSFLETKNKNKDEGIACDARRKVVISFDAKEPTLTLSGSGRFHFTPGGFSEDLATKSMSTATRAISALEVLETKSEALAPLNERAHTLFQKLFADGTISKECQRFPLQQLTEALIKSRIDTGRVNTFEGYLTGIANGTELLEPIDPAHPEKKRASIDLVNYGTGSPAVIYACFKPDKEWNAGMKEYSRQKGGVFISGTSLISEPNAKDLPDTAPMEVGFDPAQMDPKTVGGDDWKDRKVIGLSSRIGKPERGFYCNACGHGFFFEQSTDAEGQSIFNPVYDDRILKLPVPEVGKVASLNPLASALNELSKADPTAFGASLKPRMYVIQNCANCDCDPFKAIQNRDSNVTTIDPLATGPRKDYETSLTKKQMSNACIIKPPIWHTCGVNPNQVNPTKYDDFKKSLTYFDPNTGVPTLVDNMNDLVKKISSKSSCPTMSPQEKVDSVKCASAKGRRLPTSDEQADCQTEMKAAAATRAAN